MLFNQKIDDLNNANYFILEKDKRIKYLEKKIIELTEENNSLNKEINMISNNECNLNKIQTDWRLNCCGDCFGWRRPQDV